LDVKIISGNLAASSKEAREGKIEEEEIIVIE
jgi:hypothetical protein